MIDQISAHFMIFIDGASPGIAERKSLEFFLNGVELSLNSVISANLRNLINH